MKRLLALLMAMLCLPMAAFAQEEPSTLASYATALATRAADHARDERYLSLYTGDKDVLALAMQMGQGHEEPRLLLQADVTDSLLARALGTMLVSRLGAETLSAAAITTEETIFAGEAEGSGVLLALYEKAAPILVDWRGEDGAVQMRTTFLPFDDLAACATCDEVAAWFAEQGVTLSFTEAEKRALALPADGNADLLSHALTMPERIASQAAWIARNNPGALADRLNEWITEDRTAPRLILCTDTTVAAEVVAMLRELAGDMELDDALTGRAAMSLPTMIIGSFGGSQELAASSMGSQEHLFAAHDTPEAGLFLFLYDDAEPVMVGWRAENGAVLMRGYVVPGKALGACQSAGEVETLLSSVGLIFPWETVE